MIAALLAAGLIGGAEYEVTIRGTSGPGCEVDRRFTFRRGDDGLWSVERRESNLYICKGEKRLRAEERSCPALANVVAELPNRLGEPQPKDDRLILDVPTLTLRGSSPPGGTPLSQTDKAGLLSLWWQWQERALKPCWRPSAWD